MRLIVRLFMLIYYPVLFLLFALDTSVLGVTVIITSIFDSSGNTVHYIGKFWSRMNLALTGVRVNIAGLENIRPGKPYIVMSNHQSHYDVWTLIGHIPLQLRWVMKKELRAIPIFGYGCGRMGHIYIDRRNPGQSHHELEAVREKFSAGSSVVFFPEGTRSPDGNLLPFKKGGFVMSILHGVPILPVTIHGTREVLAKGSFMPMPGRIDVMIHPPVKPGEYDMTTKESLMERVREIILSAGR